MLFETYARRETRQRLIFIFFQRTIGIFLVLLVCFLNEHEENARAPRTKLVESFFAKNGTFFRGAKCGEKWRFVVGEKWRKMALFSQSEMR